MYCQREGVQQRVLHLKKSLCENVNKDSVNINKERIISTLNEHEDIDLASYYDPYTKQTCLHFCVINGHVDLLEVLMEKDPILANSVDDDCNTPFHSLCKNTISNKQDLIIMYNLLKKYGCDRRAKNINDKTGLKIIEERIKNSNPYDSSLAAVKGFMEYVEPTKHKSLMTINSCPKSKSQRFSEV